MEFRSTKILLFTKYLVLMILVYNCSTNPVFARTFFQQQNDNILVKGRVTDETGLGLPGVSVILKGKALSTQTDLKGNYSISVPNGSILIFRFIGYKSQESTVDGQKNINVQLLPSASLLDEVVVVGYGTQKKSDVTGAVTSISKDRIDNMVRTDVVQLIQGAAAGLNVTTTAAGSNPESGAVLLIRGRNSISASNEPLIVLDGVPYYGSLSDINPSDIASIEILKDASSAAIYGSRGANGVILIQTRKGEKGKARIRYDAFYARQSVANFPDLMSGEEYFQFKKGVVGVGNDDEPALTDAELAVYNSGSYDSFTWKDLILRNGNSQQHNLSVSGGSEKTTYNVSLSYLGTDGVVVNDKYKRGTSRLNITSDITNWLTLGSNTILGYTDNSGAAPSFVDLFNKSPLAVPFNPDGTVNITPIADDPRKKNPIETLLYDDLRKKYTASTNNYLNVDMPFAKGLSYRLNTGLQYESSERNWYRGLNTGKSGNLKGESETNSGNRYSYTIENILSYQRDFAKHSIFLTGLFGVEQNERKNTIINGEGFPNDFLSWYGTPQANKVTPSYLYSKTNMISQMFRANYAYDSRYLITATVRRDGYSGFGEKNKYGVFPSIALGWNIANEKFFGKAAQTFNTLKLRLSYGESGNQAINPYQTLSQLGKGDYIDGNASAPGYIPTSLGTANLGWETTRALNLGLDFALLNSKISGDINVYRNNTSDLLLRQAISPVNGVSYIFNNIGKTRNEGIELMLNSNNLVRNNFSWSSNLNFEIIKSEILDLYGDGKDDLANQWFLNNPISVNYDYRFIGVWQLGEETEAAKYGAEPGYARYEDMNGNGAYDPEDRQIIGSDEPNFTWGFTNNFKYKDFRLSVFAYGKYGVNKSNPYKDRNYLIIQPYWSPTNPTNDYWSISSQANKYLGKGNTPNVYDNADFIRIKDITLSYSIPKRITSKANIDDIGLFISGKNLFTITKWSALDPELDDQRAIPLQREYILGVNITF